jgi:hypothetical protein
LTSNRRSFGLAEEPSFRTVLGENAAMVFAPIVALGHTEAHVVIQAGAALTAETAGRTI